MNQPITQNRWVQIAIALIVIGLTYVIFFQGCGKNEHKDDKKQVDSIVQVTNIQHRSDSIRIAAYKNANDTLSKYTAIQKQKIEVLERQLDISGNRANKLAVAVANAKIVHDTVGYISNCDSLGLAVIDLTNLIDRFQVEQKHLVQGYEFQLMYKDSVIAIQASEILRDMNAVNVIGGKYEILYKDYSKLVKKHRRQSLLTRVLAGAVLGLGTAVILK